MISNKTKEIATEKKSTTQSKTSAPPSKSSIIKAYIAKPVNQNSFSSKVSKRAYFNVTDQRREKNPAYHKERS